MARDNRAIHTGDDGFAGFAGLKYARFFYFGVISARLGVFENIKHLNPLP